MTQMEQDAYMDIVLKTLGRRIEELEDFAEVTKQNYMNERKARTDEGDALRARIDEYKRITNMRNNEVCELNDLVLKKSNEIDELKKELGYVKAQNEDLKEDRRVNTAEEIAEWCRCHGDCDTCNHMQIDDGGNGECDLEIYGDEPCCWSSHVIATLDRIMAFESQAGTVVEDTEDDK